MKLQLSCDTSKQDKFTTFKWSNRQWPLFRIKLVRLRAYCLGATLLFQSHTHFKLTNMTVSKPTYMNLQYTHKHEARWSLNLPCITKKSPLQKTYYLSKYISTKPSPLYLYLLSLIFWHNTQTNPRSSKLRNRISLKSSKLWHAAPAGPNVKINFI